jgi:hypothetical protein
MKKTIHTFFIVPLSCFILLSTGCGTLWTAKGQYANADVMLARGDFAAAAAQIERSKYTHYRSKDRALYNLDLGLLQHYLGEYEASNASLEDAEQAMDAAFVKSLSRGAASLLLNDNILTYAGEDYENVYVNVFKALNYIALDEFDAAFVEIRRIDEKLKVLESRYWKVAQKYNEARETDEPFRVGKNRFQNSALGRWLSLLLYRAEGKPDDARIDLKKVETAWALQPDIYNFSPPTLAPALVPPAAGNVKVSFLSLTGQAPEKRADTFWIHTEPDQIFVVASAEKRYGGQQLAGANTLYWPGVEAGWTFKFQLPRLVKRGSRVQAVAVKIDGQRGPLLERIESLENAAEETFQIQAPLVYLKTVTRTVAKGIAAAQARRAAEEKWGESSGPLASLLAGSAVGVTENADLRISRFFPAEAYVAETELPPGVHQIEVEYYGSGGAVLYTDAVGAVEIRDDGLNLIESFYLN